MKQFFIYLFVFCNSIGFSFAQDEAFFIELSSDTVLAGNVLQVSFIANNVSGQFESPDLDGLNVVSGPNTSTSMSMINGTVAQRSSYSYNIYLEDIGEVIIPPAFFETKENTLETEPVSIIVLPNPEGIIEQPPSQSGILQFGFPSGPMKKKKQSKPSRSKKKRKLKKI